jgi:hypothetical protein
VEGVDAAHFLANIEDPANWVEHKAEGDAEAAPAPKKGKAAKSAEPEAE